MTRKELYSHITGLGLQEEIKAQWGKNYTQVSNAELETIVSEALAGMQGNDCKKLDRLIEILQKKKVLLKSEVNYICG